LMCVLAVDYANNVQSLDSAYSTIIHFQAPSSSGGGPTFIAGDGTDNNPYQIWTVDDLELARTTGDYSYKLMADIDLTGITFLPLFESGYSKTFDGNNHTISHWSYGDNTKVNGGFFTKLNNGAILKNLTISNSTITAAQIVGMLVGYNNGGNISNCHIINGEINAPTTGYSTGDNVGGMIGVSYGGTITRSSVSASVIARYVVGGLVGSAYGTIITESFTAGTIDAYDSYVGGLVGWYSNYKSSYIANSFAKVNLNSHYSGGCHGGFIGYLDKESSETVIKNSYASSTIISSGGGFAGCMANWSNYSGYSIENSFSSSTSVSSSSGFANNLNNGVLLLNVYFDITASGQSQCYPGDSGGICVGVENNSSYFTQDATMYSPTLYWDFGSIWNTDNITLPTLKNNP
jgi:hypothetical protein